MLFWRGHFFGHCKSRFLEGFKSYSMEQNHKVVCLFSRWVVYVYPKHKTIDISYICCPFSNPCSGEDIFWDKFKILYEKSFFRKFLLHINDFLYAVNEAYKLHKNTLFYEKTITISKLQFPVWSIF